MPAVPSLDPEQVQQMTENLASSAEEYAPAARMIRSRQRKQANVILVGWLTVRSCICRGRN